MERVTLAPMHRGDDRKVRVTLTLDGEAWAPPNGTVLRCTGRIKLAGTAALTDDSDAVFTVSSAGDSPGITIDGNVALVTIAAAATNALEQSSRLVCDVQATVNGERQTVAAFVLPVRVDVTRSG